MARPVRIGGLDFMQTFGPGAGYERTAEPKMRVFYSDYGRKWVATAPGVVGTALSADMAVTKLRARAKRALAKGM